jgi:hypothetical protein
MERIHVDVANKAVKSKKSLYDILERNQIFVPKITSKCCTEEWLIKVATGEYCYQNISK